MASDRFRDVLGRFISPSNLSQYATYFRESYANGQRVRERIEREEPEEEPEEFEEEPRDTTYRPETSDGMTKDGRARLRTIYDLPEEDDEEYEDIEDFDVGDIPDDAVAFQVRYHLGQIDPNYPRGWKSSSWYSRSEYDRQINDLMRDGVRAGAIDAAIVFDLGGEV